MLRNESMRNAECCISPRSPLPETARHKVFRPNEVIFNMPWAKARVGRTKEQVTCPLEQAFRIEIFLQVYHGGSETRGLSLLQTRYCRLGQTSSICPPTTSLYAEWAHFKPVAQIDPAEDPTRLLDATGFASIFLSQFQEDRICRVLTGLRAPPHSTRIRCKASQA
jgi:hypothetical protein